MDKLELMERRRSKTDSFAGAHYLFDSAAKLPADKEQWKQFCEELTLDSPFGPLSVLVQGRKGLTPIVTFHDLGMNGASQFVNFFELDEMRKLMEYFCAYHITAPGQQEGARTLNSSDPYPGMDEMADIVDYVVDKLKLNKVIGFGVGMGAHVVARTALFYPQKFIALIAVNCVCSAGGWFEWAQAKLMAFYTRHGTITHNVLSSLLTHHLGYESCQTRPDLVHSLTEYFKANLNPTNYVRLLDSYTRRTQLDVDRNEGLSKDQPNFSCPVMNTTSDFSPYLDQAVEFNGRLDPSNSTFVKLAECGGLVLDEQPNRFAEALLYFLQGMGYGESAVAAISLSSSPVCNLSVTANSLASRTHQKIIEERLTKTRSNTMCMSQLTAGRNPNKLPNEV